MRKTITIPAACRETFAALGDPLLAAWARAGLTRAGVSRVVDGYRIATPAHTEPFIIATVDGVGSVVGERSTFQATLGTVSLCPAGVPIIFSCDGPAWYFAWCYLDPRRWTLPQQPSLQRWTRCMAWSACLEGALDLVATARDQRPRGIRLQVDLVLDDLRALLGQPIRQDLDDPHEEAWQQVLDALHEPWPVERFATQVRSSVPTVQRWSHRRFGGSFHQQILRHRLDKAAGILAASDYSLAQVAALVGFADAFTFSAAFRRQRGASPGSWRRRQRDG